MAGMYRLLNASVVPRPIAWVATRSAAGIDNLAPHSYFSVACVDPPMLQFSSIGVKDTVRNVRETGEFVVCTTTEELAAQVNATATDYPPELGEFDAVGVAREPSLHVRPPRVAGSPLAFECRAEHELVLGDTIMVIGRVVHVAAHADVLVEDRRGRLLPAVEKLRPLARLGRDEWSTIGTVFPLRRIPYPDPAG